MHVLGRRSNTGRAATESTSTHGGTESPRAVAHLGSFLARDGSDGAAVGVDVDAPHAAVVFGKRGTGKSYTLGVLTAELAEADGVVPLVIDPMGVFDGVSNAGGRVIEPAVQPASIPAPAWPDLVGLDPTSGPGSLLWQAVTEATRAERHPSLDAIEAAVTAADGPRHTQRTVENHLGLARSWGVFDADAPTIASLARAGGPAVISLAGCPELAAAAVVRAVARGLYDARISGAIERLPWLLVDEAHAFFGGVADPALRTLVTRGRAPGVSLVCATQRPSALPRVAVSQADLLITHRLTADADVDALAAADATYLAGDLASRLPTGTGEALIVDDASETAHTVRIRHRRTPHGGASPRASDVHREQA